MNSNNFNLRYDPNNLNPYQNSNNITHNVQSTDPNQLLNQLSMLSNQLNNMTNNNMNNNNDFNNNESNKLLNQISMLSSQLNCMTNDNKQNTNNLRRVDGLNEKSKRLYVDENIFKIKLKPHQETLLYRVLELDEKAPKTNIPFGIMSDKPGSGKTFVILALIYYSIKFFNSKGANIIVVPHGIYTQWITAIDIFLGKKLKYICLIDYNEINQLYTDSSILYNNDIILTTPLMYDIFAGTINSLNLYVRRIFFDEADSMKKILTISINSYMTWFVSASISTVFDSSSLKAIIGKYELYLPNLLINECWCETQYIDSNIKLPKPNMEKFICKDLYIDLILANILDSEQIKHINALDYSYIRHEYGGCNVKTNKDIVKNIYEYSNKMIIDANAVLKDLEKSKIEAPDTMTKTMRKKQIYTKRQESIKNLSHKYNLCIQCFIHIDDLISHKSPCNDIICFECWNKIPTICLTCNKIHKPDSWQDEKIYQNNKVNEFIVKSQYNKFIVLDNILEICDKKIIIYSEFNGLNGYLKNYSIDYNIKIEELNGGNIKEVNRILISFRDNPDVKILLIDNAYFGVGLNIEYATDIVFFHNVDEKIKIQLIGRAQRLGRKSKLNIWEINHFNEDPNYSITSKESDNYDSSYSSKSDSSKSDSS